MNELGRDGVHAHMIESGDPRRRVKGWRREAQRPGAGRALGPCELLLSTVRARRLPGGRLRVLALARAGRRHAGRDRCGCGTRILVRGQGHRDRRGRDLGSDGAAARDRRLGVVVGSARPPPLPRDATDTPVTATSAATPAARTLVRRELFRKTASRRGICAWPTRVTIRAKAASRSADRRAATEATPTAGVSLRRATPTAGVSLRQAAAADTAADARQAASRRAASARRCWEISAATGATVGRGSRSSNRIGSAGGTGTSGGAAAKNPCSSSSQGASSVRSESLATSG